MLENAFYSVISPEGAAALLWKDAGQAKRAAESMKITAQDLFALGVVDEIVAEPLGGAHRNLAQTADSLRMALKKHLSELQGMNREQLITQRYKKYRSIGEYTALTESIDEVEVNYR